MQARYYDPMIGRFYSNDPIGSIEHLSTQNGIHGFNRYAYVNNNPYKYVDSDGKETLFAFHADLDVREFSSGNISRSELSDRFDQRVSGSAAVSTFIPGGALLKGASTLPKIFAARHLSKVLTPAQVARMKTIKNIIHRNARGHDFEGVLKELKGISTGFDHIQEMQQSVRGLTKAINGLKGSLKNPNLDKAARNAVQKSIDKGQAVLNRMKDTLGGG